MQWRAHGGLTEGPSREPSVLKVVGGGLAGCEAALAAAKLGLSVELFEMRPHSKTPAHRTAHLGELVCSNSLGSSLPDRAGGLLQEELRRLGSSLMACAAATAVPAGGALAVDRDGFAQLITRTVEAHPNITLVRQEAMTVPAAPAIVATGPLTSQSFAADLMRITGEDYLYFYDALSPIVEAGSIDMTRAFVGSRYGRGEDAEGDYINCPMTENEYNAFTDELVRGERIELAQFESEDPHFFEGCLPIEVMAARSRASLAFGPLRPVGLRDPRTGRRPHAVVQLRRDDLAGSLYNVVGFQTNLTWPEQRRIFAMIPGLEVARWVRLGQMHRNTFVNSPHLLDSSMELTGWPGLFLAGQIVGIEGYVGNIGSGLLAGVNAARVMGGLPALTPPPTTMLGALANYVAHAEPATFQPMKANFGLLPPPESGFGKAGRRAAYSERALSDLDSWLAETEWLPKVRAA